MRQPNTEISQPFNSRKWLTSLISPYSIIPESNIKVMRKKEMIANSRSSWLDWCTNSPRQYQRKCIENSMENKHSDVGFSRVINLRFIPYLWLSSSWFISSSNSMFSALTLAHCWFWLSNDSLPLARLYNQTETKLILNIITEDCIWETCTHVRNFVS